MNSTLLLGFQAMSFESDYHQLVKLLNNEEVEEWPALMAESEEFLQLFSKFQFWSISFIPRTLNSRADSLAKEARARNAVFSHVQVSNRLALTNLSEPR